MNDLARIIDQVSRDKGIEREILIMTLEEAIRSAAKKKFGPRHELEVTYNEELEEIEVFEFKEVVELVEDDALEISLAEGKKLDPDCEIGDELGVKMDTDTFGRIAAQSAKQVIIQRIKDAERDIIYEDFKDRQGEIINGIVTRYDKGSLIVNLGRTDAVLPPREQVPRESYRPGDRVRAWVLDVKRISRGPQIILSRTHPEFLKALFEMEVPEIAEGVVEIVSVAREPGGRTKIAVASRASDVDPVGACVGVKGSRVQSVVQELRGEKIDIIPWNADPAKFVCNSLAPAEVSRVIIDEADRTMEVIVPDEHLSLAIGRKGQNVRLAGKLTGWRIDVVSDSDYSQQLRDGYRSLLEITVTGELIADTLFASGYTSAEQVAGSTIEELAAIDGIDEAKAEELVQVAAEYLVAEQAAAEQAAAEQAAAEQAAAEQAATEAAEEDD
ncbi:MAG: transcription termination factor NusA, partial [Proteobacteria bacterium]|nr:transcription termination factor NusA [Pseudomonadota bacterium]